VTLSARIALAAPVARVTVVTGCDAEDVEAALKGLVCPRLITTRNEQWQNGIASSLRAGLKALPLDTKSVIVFLGDMPLVPSEIPSKLLKAVDGGASAALTRVAGKPAQPVAFSRSLFSDVCELEGDQGARRLLMSLPDAVHIESDQEGCFLDVDEPADRITILRML